MATGGRAPCADMRGFYAKEVAERRRLKDILCEQLSRDLLRLLNEEIHTDMIVCVGQEKLKAHKAVLLARTPHFYKYITRNVSLGINSLRNIEASEIQAFLKVVYSSHWSVKETEEHILSQIDQDWQVPRQDQNDESWTSLQSNRLSATENVDDKGRLHDAETSPSENGELKSMKDYNINLETASDLGSELLSLLHHSRCPDITIQIEDNCFQAHRAILCARSSYFAAMLNGCWAESSQDLIQIRGIYSADMTVMMHFIYGGMLDLPKCVDPGQILSTADMYGLEGLKDVAIHVLKRDYCKFFHKPVVGMQQSVLECLAITHSLGEEQLYSSCMRWIEKYFVKCWSERSFASLSVDLQKRCLTFLVQSLSYRNAAFLLMESDRLISSLPGVKWAERAMILASELHEECVRFMVTNFSQIIKSDSFSHLLQAQGMSSRPYLLEHIFNEIEKSISTQNCSSLFMALDELLNVVSENELGFTCKIQSLRDKLWTFLLQSFYAVRHTEGWKLMRPDYQKKIQAAAVDKGDDRRLTKKPVFTSSQQNRSRIAENKESERHSEGDLSNSRKMKSDSLGASGHTANVSRNSSGKAKDEDVKGKDGKKMVTKGAKDPKPLEKEVTTKPKVITKTKTESNGSVKTESTTPKGESTGTQKAAAGRLGARPKVSNGGVNAQPKLRSLKKTSKEPSSPVKVGVPNVKSGTSNGEQSNCKRSPGESTHDKSADDLNSTNSSPQSVKPLRSTLDGPKDLGLAKSKSPAKGLNGASTKRKVNEGEMNRNTCFSSTKKLPANEGSESVLQKKKGIKTNNCAAQQRPKSAPASMSKKTGIHGDGAGPLKSVVSSKQAEIKSDTTLLNPSTFTDKHGPSAKKITKTASTSKIISQTAALTKQGSNVNKSSTMNHKEPKQKVVCGSQSSKVNHKQEQKDASNALKNGHDQRTLPLAQDQCKADGLEGIVCLENQSKQAVPCQSVEESSLSEQGFSEGPDSTVHECYKDDSIGNQNPVTLKPNLEGCHCQENTLTACAELYSSDSKEGLTDIKKQTKVVNADNMASEHLVLNILSDPKPEGKNICDSENSKCADSSSESELCSVKEVETNTKEEKDLSKTLAFPQNTNRAVHTSKQNAEPCLQSMNSSGHFMNYASGRLISDCPGDRSIAEALGNHENNDIHFVGSWNKHSRTLHERESPESESGSASTSSDDIKPRSEDYDAGGSQDDDGSNERGISKCSTMRCHDFLGRSSSDTSTPEELKGYDGSLRIDVKVKKDHSADLFRVNSTSDDEGPRKRPETWLQRDLSKHGIHPKALCSTVQFPQEVEHFSSSADETEDERSEAENAADKVLLDETSQPFQGIVNLAFDDVAEIESEGQLVSGNKSFMRSVLLSVDECEELGSDEGETHGSQMHKKAESLTPADVFESGSNGQSDTKYPGCSKGECGSKELRLQDDGNQSGNTNSRFSQIDPHSETCVEGAVLVAERQARNGQSHMEGHDVADSDMYKGFYKHPESEYKSQARPCHLDLYTTDSPSDTQRFCPAKTLNACKSDIHDYQGKENHASPTESSAFPAGFIDDFDSLAQTCIYEHRPSKSLSPIHEMDPGDGIEQTTEAQIMDFGFEDQQFIDGDWTLLRQLLAEHGSDVDIINSVPEDLSLAQYLINQTLLLARENSKSQGKASVDTSSKWGDLASPFDDSTSATVTSFSPDNSSPHGEWTILELETHH
ncbi:BTB/POZ domain-containing protein 8 isoform 2-T2 [Pelodytes ibericus]